MKKEQGQIELVSGMFFLLFLILFLAVQLQLLQFLTTSLYMEDALAASNLASAVIDAEKYGMTHEITIGSAEAAYGIYETALKDNLNLDDAWECSNKSAVGGKVEIRNYTVYNVSGQDVEICRFDREGKQVWTVSGGLGIVEAPNGVRIESTSIYSEIGFPVSGILGVRVDAQKGKLVDVVAQLTEGNGGI